MSASAGSPSTYALGRTESETRRLMLQATIYDPLMCQFLVGAGLASGMKILDLGSGAGDVAFLAADIVGPSGYVIGIDVNADILELARRRAVDNGLSNVTFQVGDCRTSSLPNDFDAVIGRYVLGYTGDPASTLKSVLNYLRPGGIVAFAETEMGVAVDFSKRGPSDIAARHWTWSDAVFQHADNHPSMAIYLYRAFLESGLGAPEMLLLAPMGGGQNWLGYQLREEAARSLLPLIEQYGIATAEEVDIETLKDRLQSDAEHHRVPVMLLPMVTAWARKPVTQFTIIQAE